MLDPGTWDPGGGLGPLRAWALGPWGPLRARGPTLTKGMVCWALGPGTQGGPGSPKGLGPGTLGPRTLIGPLGGLMKLHGGFMRTLQGCHGGLKAS